jgi:hypothetical protein
VLPPSTRRCIFSTAALSSANPPLLSPEVWDLQSGSTRRRVFALVRVDVHNLVPRRLRLIPQAAFPFGARN